MNPADTLYFNIVTTQQYSQNSEIEVFENCNGMSFFNAGATVATVNGIPIPAGGSWQFGGNQGEIFLGRCNVAFAAGVSLLIVIQKIYIKRK